MFRPQGSLSNDRITNTGQYCIPGSGGRPQGHCSTLTHPLLLQPGSVLGNIGGKTGPLSKSLLVCKFGAGTPPRSHTRQPWLPRALPIWPWRPATLGSCLCCPHGTLGKLLGSSTWPGVRLSTPAQVRGKPPSVSLAHPLPFPGSDPRATRGWCGKVWTPCPTCLQFWLCVRVR